MDILKAATDWAKAELFSTPFFILFGLIFMATSFGFHQLGKTEMARAYIIPTLIAGILLLIIGLGLFFTNKSRISQFEKDYNSNVVEFLDSEIGRAESTLKEYKNIVFTAVPLIIATCALILVFVSGPTWRASLITVIAMMVVILLVDGTAHARIDSYHKQLLSAKKELEK